MSDETKKKISKNQPSNKNYSDEFKQRQHERLKERWKDPEYRKLALSKLHSKILCKHCLKSVTKCIHTQFHGNNCLSNPNFEAENTRKIRKLGPQKIIDCPYCNKKGGISAMKQWHFNNCKHKPQ